MEKSEVIGSLFRSAGEEGEDGSDPNRVEAEERVAGTGREEGEEERERETEEQMVKLVWGQPWIFVVIVVGGH